MPKMKQRRLIAITVHATIEKSSITYKNICAPKNISHFGCTNIIFPKTINIAHSIHNIIYQDLVTQLSSGNIP